MSEEKIKQNSPLEMSAEQVPEKLRPLAEHILLQIEERELEMRIAGDMANVAGTEEGRAEYISIIGRISAHFRDYKNAFRQLAQGNAGGAEPLLMRELEREEATENRYKQRLMTADPERRGDLEGALKEVADKKDKLHALLAAFGTKH